MQCIFYNIIVSEGKNQRGISTNEIMSLKKNSLQDLISAGPDAQSNQYDVHYSFSDESSNGIAKDYLFKVRVGDFSIPSLARKSVSIDYQNVQVPIQTNFASLTRTSKFSFRVDSYFELYKLFAKRIKDGSVYQPFYENGDTSCLDTIRVVYEKQNIMRITPMGADEFAARRANIEADVESNFVRSDLPNAYRLSNKVVMRLLRKTKEFGELKDDEPYNEKGYEWVFKNVILKQIELSPFTRESCSPLRATVTFDFGYIREDADTYMKNNQALSEEEAMAAAMHG